MMRSHSCPKCQSTMAQGFVPVEHSGMRAILSWSLGVPRKSWWGVKAGGKPIEIVTWRCQRCGFLENYAPG